MGLISAALSAASSTLSQQWKEYFYCEALPFDVLAVKGKKRQSGVSSNKDDNIISSGRGWLAIDPRALLGDPEPKNPTDGVIDLRGDQPTVEVAK